jgi:hypothetical protein
MLVFIFIVVAQTARAYLRIRCCSTESTLSILFFVASICLSKRPSCKLACVRDSAATAAEAAATTSEESTSKQNHYLLANHITLSLEKRFTFLRCLLSKISATATSSEPNAASATRCEPRDTSSSPRADLDHGMSHVLEVAAYVQRRRERHKHCRRGGWRRGCVGKGARKGGRRLTMGMALPC